MYNVRVVGAGVRIQYLLFALLMAVFVSFYPQLDAAGYCDGGGCPEVSYSAHGAGAASGGPGGSGISFVVAALVVVPSVLRARASRSALMSCSADVLVGIALSPEVPPPRPST